MRVDVRAKGECITLRPVRRSDLGSFRAWLNDPSTRAYLDAHFVFGVTLREEGEFLDLITRNPEFMAFSICDSAGTLVGIAGLDYLDRGSRTAELGIIIGPKYRRRHCGSDAHRTLIRLAFDRLRLERVWGKVSVLNAHWLESVLRDGMRQEGILREHRFHQGRRHDEIVVGMTREDYLLRDGRTLPPGSPSRARRCSGSRSVRWS